MSQPTVCLSLAPNLRCIAFDQLKSEVLIIPPAIEVIVCTFLIVLKRRPDRLHILLAADGILYFIIALCDLLLHVAPAARLSPSILRSLDIFLGSVSFAPLIIYSLYLYCLSRREFIPNLPQRLQALTVYSLAILMVLVVAFNEVASFADVTNEVLSTEGPFTTSPTYGEDTSWLPWSQLSLATFTAIQILSFLLAFYRLGKAFLDQRRIEITQSDEHHFLNGIVWITVGLKIGVIEALAGFTEADFTVALARRILRMISRTALIVSAFKGLDHLENFGNLVNELRGGSHFSRRLSQFFGFNSRSTILPRTPQLHASPSLELGLSLYEKQRNGQRVTVHYEKNQAPFLQIRFSGLNFPSQAILADGKWTGRSSGLAPGIEPLSAGLPIAPETLRARSGERDIQSNSTDWNPPPMIGHTTRRESRGTISDNLSIVRDLELRFPDLPPRVTGRYRGSILGRRHEEDLFPVVGVSRESSLRKNDSVLSTTEAGSPTGVRSTSGSIKRKPAPPLLANPTHILGNRPLSTWGGLAQNSVQYPAISPTTPALPWGGVTTHCSYQSSDGETESPKPARRMIPRNLFKRVSRAMSETSIRSAEWLASARPHQSLEPHLTTGDIEIYRNGFTVPSLSYRLSDGPGLMADKAGETCVHRNTRKSADDAFYVTGPRGPRVGRIVAMKTPTPTPVDHELGRERVSSSHGSVSVTDNVEERMDCRTVIEEIPHTIRILKGN